MNTTLSKLTPEFDYNILLSHLVRLKNPRAGITSLLKRGEIIRVKKGMYVLGSQYEKPFSHEILANLIYGPSYISLEFALSHYGLIPDRVKTITSINSKRNKVFKTPVGDFTYSYLPKLLYSVGLRRVQIDSKRAYIIASKEKAIIDILYRFKKLDNEDQLDEFLVSGLRIEKNELKNLHKETISEMAKLYKSNNVDIFSTLIRKMKS
jgi:predicted transcriptional regulator of viral defense system